MMRISNEAKVGFLGLAALAILYIGFNYLKGTSVFSSEKEFTAVFADVDGLQTSNPVLINGMQVGTVNKIELLPAQNNALKVSFSVINDVKVTDKSQVILADFGLISGKALRLNILPGTLAKNEAELEAITEEGLMKSIGSKAGPVMTHADSLVVNLNTIVKQFENTGAALKLLIASAQQTTGGVNATLAANAKNIGAVTTNAAQLTDKLNLLAANISETEKQLGPLLKTANVTMGKTASFADTLGTLKLNETVHQLNKSVAGLQGILAQVNAGKGTLGKLTSNDSLYKNLDNTAASLNLLLGDLKQNPKRYVHFSLFGKK